MDVLSFTAGYLIYLVIKVITYYISKYRVGKRYMKGDRTCGVGTTWYGYRVQDYAEEIDGI